MFGKNKKKLDSRVRFQHRGFRNRLNSQRNYKRSAKVLPQTDWGIFLSKIGLGGWISKILTFFTVLLLIYVVYIPNLFFIKQVKISGLNPQSEQIVKNSINLFLNRKLPFPQKNLLVLSKNKLTDFLLNSNQEVLFVNKIEKDFPNTLVLNFTERTDGFIVQSPKLEFYSIAQDGLVTNQVFPDASGTLPSNLLLIKLGRADLISLHQKLFKESQFNFIRQTSQELPAALKTTITSIDISDLENPFFSVNTQVGYVVKLDSSSDFKKTLSRLGLLTSQILPGDIKNLAYIDLRFSDRAYTCSKNNQCLNNVSPQPATTTAPTITN